MPRPGGTAGPALRLPAAAAAASESAPWHGHRTVTYCDRDGRRRGPAAELASAASELEFLEVRSQYRHRRAVTARPGRHDPAVTPSDSVTQAGNLKLTRLLV